MVTEEDKAFLLAAARRSIASRFSQVPDNEDAQKILEEHPHLARKGGAFVTLNTIDANGQRQLRGCIGSLSTLFNIYDTVCRMSLQAAFQDPRFPALSKEELDTVIIEISLLTQLSPIPSFHEIRIGIDGILFSCRGRSALFLPQVATEQGWDLETTLGYLAQKAGLEPDAYLDPCASFEVFQAIVFSEDEVSSDA